MCEISGTDLEFDAAHRLSFQRQVQMKTHYVVERATAQSVFTGTLDECLSFVQSSIQPVQELDIFEVPF